MSSEHIRLQKHLNIIAESQRQSHCYFIVDTNLDNWIKYNINTVEEYERYNSQLCHSELYREINGVKPSWIDYSTMTVEEIKKEIHNMINEQKNLILEEKEDAKAYAKIIQNRKAANAYKPNLVFLKLKSLFS